MRSEDHGSVAIFLFQVRDKPLLTPVEEVDIAKARDNAKAEFEKEPTPCNFKAYRVQVNRLTEGITDWCLA